MPDANRPGRLDLYFYCLAAFSAINTVLFVWPVAVRYRDWAPAAAACEASLGAAALSGLKRRPSTPPPSPRDGALAALARCMSGVGRVGGVPLLPEGTAAASRAASHAGSRAASRAASRPPSQPPSRHQSSMGGGQWARSDDGGWLDGGGVRWASGAWGAGTGVWQDGPGLLGPAPYRPHKGQGIQWIRGLETARPSLTQV